MHTQPLKALAAASAIALTIAVAGCGRDEPQPTSQSAVPAPEAPIADTQAVAAAPAAERPAPVAASASQPTLTSEPEPEPDAAVVGERHVPSAAQRLNDQATAMTAAVAGYLDSGDLAAARGALGRLTGIQDRLPEHLQKEIEALGQQLAARAAHARNP